MVSLSTETRDTIEFFSKINQGIVFRKGNVIKTMSPQKNILVEADITEVIPNEFGIYNLGELLGTISLFKDDFDINFGDKKMEITGRSSRSKTTYSYTDPSLIIVPPVQMPTMAGKTVTFSLTKDDLAWVKSTAAVLKSPQIVVESDGTKVYLSTMDVQNDAANVNQTEIGDGNGDKYKLVFKIENFQLMSDDYSVVVSDKMGKFTNKAGNLKVWIATEVGSKFA